MNSISFKDIKFFSGRTTPRQKGTNKSPNNNNEKGIFFWQKLVKSPFLHLFIFVAIIAYFISYLPSRALPQLAEGEIASADIVSPADLTIEDREATEKRRNEAEQTVLPVYNLDQNVFLNTEDKIREFHNSGRELLTNPVTTKSIEEFKATTIEKFGTEISTNDIRALIKIKFAIGLEENLISLIGKISGQGIILKNLFIHGEEEKGIALIRSPELERSIRVSGILDITESKELLSEEIDKLELSQSESNLLKSLSSLFISPNVNYNNLETEVRKAQARNSVGTVFYTIKKGKVIIRKGDEITQDTIKQIDIINQNLSTQAGWLINYLGTFLLFGLLFLTLWYYLKSLSKPEEAFKYFLMMGVTLILNLLFYKLSIFLSDTFSQSSNFFLLKYNEAYRYAFPFQFGTLLFAFLTRLHIALIFAIINSLLVGYLFNSNFYLMFFSLIGGIAAIYGIKYYGKQKITNTFRAGLFLVAPISIFIIISFHLIRERIGSVDFFASELLMGLLGGALSAALAFLFLPIFENLFGFLTHTKLLELTNSELPIFRKMAMEAPGSYHHSLIVATLAEKAAEEIKLDPMLVKAGALYHDLGKIKRPEYFMENRAKNIDMHKTLKPSMSTLVIINHVKEGLEMAKKLKLPRKLRDMIAQHHGDSLVRYFFEKAKEEYDPEMQKIGEESYRYAGPKPTSKEAALILLADSIEAASRSLKSPTKTNLKRVISDLFNNYVQDGQLDDCDFSFKELRVIADSFLSTLYSIYHHRSEYPGFDFEKKNTNKNKKEKFPNDRNLKQTA